MNYYERHIGDYIKDTVSLSMLEDGAYNRLIDQAYQTEEALPLDKREIYRLARATSTAERKAVDYVLNKFWQQTESGYVQKRIQTEIERYQDKQRKAKASADARWNKNKSQSEGNANASQTHDAKGMRTHSDGNAHQTPDTRLQSPDSNKSLGIGQGIDNSTVVDVGDPDACHDLGQICQVLKRHSVVVNPGEVRLRELAKQGVILETLSYACEQAKEKYPGQRITAALVIGFIANWKRDAAKLDVKGARAPHQGPDQDTLDRQNAEAHQLLFGEGAPHG